METTGRATEVDLRTPRPGRGQEAQLTHPAMYDPLTGLPNRDLFLDRLELAIARGRREHTGVTLLIIDLDRSEAVDHQRGHGVDDELLAGLAQRLADVVRSGDTVARLGGDEFAMVCDTGSPPAAERIVARVRAAISQPFSLSRGSTAVRASIGVAVSERADHSSESLLREADPTYADTSAGSLQAGDDGPQPGAAAPTVGAEAAGRTLSARFRPYLTSVAPARHFLSTALRQVAPDLPAERSDDLLLGAGELVANCIVHGRTEFEVRVTRDDTTVRVSLHDGNTRLPQPCHAPADATSGRGLHIVDALGLRWAIEREPDGKQVWLEADL